MGFEDNTLVPTIGIPIGNKQAGRRVDFRTDYIEIAIETKGYLLAWERAAICPCAPIVEQSNQPNLNCPLCKGKGYFYFGQQVEQDLSEYTLDEIQTRIVQANNAILIRGVMTGLGSTTEPFQNIGTWGSGESIVTVRYQNKIGYYDKLTGLDAHIVFAESIDTDGTNLLKTRYLVVSVNYIRSIDKIYKPHIDYTMDKGNIYWLPNMMPVKGTRITIHYLCHPTWLVQEHPNAVRTTVLKFKKPVLKTPVGDALQMPIRARVRYDFIE